MLRACREYDGEIWNCRLRLLKIRRDKLYDGCYLPRIARHQGSYPNPLFETIVALAKGTERLAHENTLLSTDVRNRRAANEALSKRREAKKTCVRQGGALTV